MSANEVYVVCTSVSGITQCSGERDVYVQLKGYIYLADAP